MSATANLPGLVNLTVALRGRAELTLSPTIPVPDSAFQWALSATIRIQHRLFRLPHTCPNYIYRPSFGTCTSSLGSNSPNDAGLDTSGSLTHPVPACISRWPMYRMVYSRSGRPSQRCCLPSLYVKVPNQSPLAGFPPLSRRTRLVRWRNHFLCLATLIIAWNARKVKRISEDISIFV